MRIHLCFHGIGVCTDEREPGESRYWVSQDVFHGILDLVSEFPGVDVSFDDGNASDIDVALPALSERGLTAKFFVLAGRLDDPASLSVDDLRALVESGMAIGSHGWSHISLRALSEADAHRELVDARTALENVSGRRISEIALPLGRYDRQLLMRLKKAGYATVYTSDRFPARSSAWLQARYSVTATDTVDSIAAVLRRPPGIGEARNLLASTVKRVR